MGTKAAEALDVSFDELPNYLHAKHSVYMEIGSETYYLTDVNDRYWRAQDTAKHNVDPCSAYDSFTPHTSTVQA